MTRPIVLVTGATGLIGSRLVRELAPAWTVFALGRNANASDLLPPAQRLVVDLAAGWDESSLPERLDAVVHLAQADDYRRFPEGAGAMHRVNVDATARLL